jgi:hypothetical protein
MGQVEVTYEFKYEYCSLAKLAGSFQVDQSYLPALTASTQELIASLSENIAQLLLQADSPSLPP